jgi:FtsZ-binding cell division protein ZapB
MRNKELELQDTISLQKVEIANLLKKKDILQNAVAQYENERQELVVSAHKTSSDNVRLQKEIDAIKLLNEQNGDISVRCFDAERTLQVYQIGVVILLLILIFLIIR